MNKQDALSRLLDQVSELLITYEECNERDDIFEVKKKIRLKLNELEKQIKYLKASGGEIRKDGSGDQPSDN